AGAYALVGMGAVFAGSARAPITAVIIVFELTGEYTIILPLMLAIVVAAAVSSRLSPDTIYTLKLRRRGIDVNRPRVVSVMRTVPVSAAMSPMPEPLDAGAPLTTVMARLTEGHGGAVPVVDADGALVGLIGALDVEEHAMSDAATAVTAADLAHTPRTLRLTDTLEDASRALSLGDDDGVPVLAGDDRRPAGWTTHRDVLRAYQRERARLTPDEAPPGAKVIAPARASAASAAPL
ncbi:MAG TPA: chloride channel protein, partial [Baekduia sp.]